jgi:hypothetical protein
MSEIFYLLDENVDPVYRSGLLEREPQITIWRVGTPGLPPLGTLDPEILVWCEENGFLLVTNNRTSMPEHLLNHINTGRHIPGILVINPKMSIGETIEELLLIWGASSADEYQDRIIHLPVD